MEKFLKIKSFLFIILVIASFFASCSDDPNSVGINSVPSGDKLQTSVFNTLTEKVDQSIVTFRKDSLFWGSSSRLLLGSYKNITSEILISFQMLLPDSILTPLQENDGITLVSSWIELYPTYWIGDSTNFVFSAHEINTHWTSVKIDQDTINNIRAQLGDNILTDYEFAPSDTVIKFNIGNDVVSKWVNTAVDATLPDDNGIMLKPVSLNGIVGFQALASYPTGNYPTLFLVFEKAGEFIDTVLAYPRLDIHIPSGEQNQDPVNSVFLQGSIGVRGRLLFNLDTLPQNILVNYANLELFVDDINTFEGSIESDTLIASFYHDFATDSLRDDFGKYQLLRSNGKYSIDISRFVQRWAEGEKNEGLELKLSDESRSPAAVALYASDHPVESLRPRLIIYYTK